MGIVFVDELSSRLWAVEKEGILILTFILKEYYHQIWNKDKGLG